MTKAIETYLEATRQCLEQCEQMTELEQEKRQALLGDDGGRLEAVLQNQQAAVMALETLEKKRLAAQQAAGWPEGASAEEILGDMPAGPEQEELTALVAGLRRTAADLKELNKTAIDIARQNLQIFSHGKHADAPGKSVTYRPGGAGSGWSGGPGFEQKI